MGFKKNILYNGFLTTGLYLSQLITYPYVTRVLGAENLGICNFIQSYVQFFLLCSALGISTLGVREIAKNSHDKESLNKTFSRLFLLTSLTTIISLLLYIVIGLSVAQISAYPKLLCIGAFNILLSLFNIEWFYRGIEDFRYITYRTLIIRIVYVLLVFLLIRNESHYIRYFLLTLLAEAAKSSINWFHSKQRVTFKLPEFSEIGGLWKSNFLIGLQIIFLSYNSTINPMFLGLFASNTEVGYYTVASKLTLIVLMFYNAYTLVVLPRVSSLIGKNNRADAQSIIGKSYSLLYLLVIPIIIFVEVYTPEIIRIIAGPGYEGVITPMRITIPIILVGGISQITINQVLIPNNLEKYSTFASVLGVLSCILFNLLFVSKYQSVASAVSWLCAETVITIISLIYAKKHITMFSARVSVLMKYMIVFSPLFILILIKEEFESIGLQIAIPVIIAIVYINIIMYYVLEDENYVAIIGSIRKRLLDIDS